MVKARDLPNMNGHFAGSHGSLERAQLTHNVRMSDMALVETVEKVPLAVRSAGPFSIRDYLLANGQQREADAVVSDGVHYRF